MQNAVTQKHIGITNHGYGFDDDKFGEVRHLAINELIERKNKARRDKSVKVPKYSPGDKVIVSIDRMGEDRVYHLYEIIDFEEDTSKYRNTRIVYYGILLKTTSMRMLGRIGRIRRINYNTFGHEEQLSKYEESSCHIKWVE